MQDRIAKIGQLAAFLPAERVREFEDLRVVEIQQPQLSQVGLQVSEGWGWRFVEGVARRVARDTAMDVVKKVVGTEAEAGESDRVVREEVNEVRREKARIKDRERDVEERERHVAERERWVVETMR